MLKSFILNVRRGSKPAHKGIRTDRVMNDYRRIEYASEWGSDNRMRPVFPLNCDARIKYGI